MYVGVDRIRAPALSLLKDGALAVLLWISSPRKGCYFTGEQAESYSAGKRQTIALLHLGAQEPLRSAIIGAPCRKRVSAWTGQVALVAKPLWTMRLPRGIIVKDYNLLSLGVTFAMVGASCKLKESFIHGGVEYERFLVLI